MKTPALIALALLAGSAATAQGLARYPAEALRLRQEGRVVIHLTVSRKGRVRTCAIKESSGAPSLDRDACEQALKNVQFAPAHDAKGDAIESTYDLPVRYVLPPR